MTLTLGVVCGKGIVVFFVDGNKQDFNGRERERKEDGVGRFGGLKEGANSAAAA